MASNNVWLFATQQGNFVTKQFNALYNKDELKTQNKTSLIVLLWERICDIVSWILNDEVKTVSLELTSWQKQTGIIYIQKEVHKMSMIYLVCSLIAVFLNQSTHGNNGILLCSLKQ